MSKYIHFSVKKTGKTLHKLKRTTEPLNPWKDRFRNFVTQFEYMVRAARRQKLN